MVHLSTGLEAGKETQNLWTAFTTPILYCSRFDSWPSLEGVSKVPGPIGHAADGGSLPQLPLNLILQGVGGTGEGAVKYRYTTTDHGSEPCIYYYKGTKMSKYCIRFRDVDEDQMVEAERLEEEFSSYVLYGDGDEVVVLVARDTVLSITKEEALIEA